MEWQKKDKESREWHDWVGELFPPTLNLEKEKILEGVTKDGAIKSKIKRVSVLDPETVREVYQKVHMMVVQDEEMKKSEHSETVQEETGEDKKSTQTVEVDPSNENLWNSNEISVLRKVFKTVKRENMKLKVKNREIEVRNMELEKKYNVALQEIDGNKFKLSEIIKANARLKIHCDQLQADLDETNVRMTAMEQIFKEINEEKAKMVKEVHELRIAADRERMSKQSIQLKLDSLKQEALSEKIAAEESIKIQCRDQIANLEKNVMDLTSELNKEIKAHRTTKKGLDHLRTHFASLPLSHIIPPNAVQSDQISHFQY